MKNLPPNFLILTLAVAQILDGTLTYIGLSYMIAQEGNPIVRAFIENLGLGIGLATVKGLALLVLLMLYLSSQASKLTKALAVVTLLYWCVIVSWVLILAWNLEKLL